MEGEQARINKLGIPRRRYKELEEKAIIYELSHDTKHLYCIEATEAKSICLIEGEIDRFLKTAYRNHEQFVDSLTLDYPVGRAY